MDAERIKEKMRYEMGEIICSYMANPEVVEIMVNADGKIWVECFGKNMEAVGEMDNMRVLSLISTVASFTGACITKKDPILECELPFDGSRFEAVIPPIVSAPIFTIRKKPLKIYTLEDYLSDGSLRFDCKEKIEGAILDRLNILIAGGTGSGKTTFANAIIDKIRELNPNHRLVIIEDTFELQSRCKNSVFMKTSESKDSTSLLKTTMRLRPDRIIIGELRGVEALTALKAWNTGHPGGVATVHANSAEQALHRLEQLIMEAINHPMHKLISEAVDMIVFIKKTKSGRSVEQILKVKGYRGEYIYDKDQNIGHSNVVKLVNS